MRYSVIHELFFLKGAVYAFGGSLYMHSRWKNDASTFLWHASVNVGGRHLIIEPISCDTFR